MPQADRDRLIARTQANYDGFGYAPLLAADMRAVATVGNDAAADSGTAVASMLTTTANAVSANNSAAVAAATVPVLLDRTVGRRVNDTGIWSMIRSTPAWGTGPTGALEEAAIDTLSFDFDLSTLAPRGPVFAGQRINEIPNSRCQGSVNGTPGTAPTGWTIPATFSGLSTSIIGSGTEAGIPYVDVRVFGTPSASSATNLATFVAGGVVSATPGETRSGWFFCSLVAGSMANISLNRVMSNGGGSGTQVGAAFVPAAGALSTQRFGRNLLANAGTTWVNTSIRINCTISLAVDATFRIGAPSQELGIFQSLPILNVSGTPGARMRAQGNVTIPVAQLGSRWNRRQGIILIDWNSQPGAFTSADDADWFGLVSWGDTTANERLGILLNPAHTSLEARVTAGGVVQTASSRAITAPTAGLTTRAAVAWDLDAAFLQVAGRGAAGTKVALTALPIPGNIMPGRFATTNPLFGAINGLEVRPAAVFDAALAALT